MIKVTKYVRNIKPPIYQLEGHSQTIFPALTRRVRLADYQRERIPTPDNDFLDLDWIRSNSKKLVLLCHGLEGNSGKPYIKGMARFFAERNWAVIALNFRGCSEEINKQLRFYHSGATDDLHTVLAHISKNYQFSQVNLIGFSLGGNIILKFLGENKYSIPKNIHKAITFSVPLHLHSSCIQLSSGFNLIYSKRFLRMLKAKVKRKANYYPEYFDLKSLSKVTSLIDFDELITAPLNGFKNAIDYYNQSSAIFYLKQISVPTLIVNSKNDPFLSSKCYPIEELMNHSFIELMIPEQGGHCGFADTEFSSRYWSEELAWKYLNANQYRSINF